MCFGLLRRQVTVSNAESVVDGEKEGWRDGACPPTSDTGDHLRLSGLDKDVVQRKTRQKGWHWNRNNARILGKNPQNTTSVVEQLDMLFWGALPAAVGGPRVVLVGYVAQSKTDDAVSELGRV
ncbi:uncharacterized protein M437DRAFT_66565 [Aureobasidium melanogenum CBS 110374]|uniref:Uncharacterized protein n=1 Tax=Aureobasidium melanogenum (strain CBS 110374) TaxID=1043003 RepID=A0A074VN59_AURM1|nr:uncharacterized protein M437DRAFT_66565 [Aureobasidium melanogenum CBS 110374]KEQ62125.1 hypothetical protein M437DRAFT_66565 [Aureobasidium melanogenum CBS 110374]